MGMSRFKNIQPFLPFSREKFRQLVREKKAPQPTYLGSRCAMYKNEELHKFLADPANYRVGGQS
jgi:predicted DNA-binding transcriptional regulator AlpA